MSRNERRIDVRKICLASMSAALALVPAAASAQTAASPTAPAKGANLEASADERAKATLAKMTLEEKITLLHGPMPALMSPSKRPAGIAVGAGYVLGVPRLGIPAQVETDASLGVSNLFEMRKGDVATALPSGISLASTWDPALAHAGGAMIGSEARAKGFNVMLAGGVNLVRDPRGGRSFEYLGEDPLLAGVMGGQQIAGVQSNRIIATIKHFALNDQETGRNVASVEMDEAAARESDLLAFQIGIEQGNPGSVMCGYNRAGGAYVCENAFLLNDVLRRDWGYKGYVMSDWGAVHSTEALVKGLDQQSGEQLDGKKYFSTLLAEKVAGGAIPSSAVDMAAGRILRSMYAFGVIDHPATGGQAIDYEANAAIAQRAAEAGIVLLRNEGRMLPLASSARRIVVIGGSAESGVPSGGGSSQVLPVGGFRKMVKLDLKGPAASIARQGFGGTPPVDGLRAEFPSAQITYLDGLDHAAAAAAAKTADVAIVFADKFSTEAADQEDLSLGNGQDALIDAVAMANPKTVVVLETGNPVTMPWRDKVPAIVSAWYGGQRGGAAIARILSGAVNPSGHLPVTFPTGIEQLPNPVLPGSDVPVADKGTQAVYGLQAGKMPFEIRYPEGSDAGYRWFDLKRRAPLYPFGHGLSYTSFRYDSLKVTGGRNLTVTFSVTNTGDRAGADVPQVYVRSPGKAKRLIGWSKPMLAPGETRTVTVTADPRILGQYDVKRRQWIVPAATFGVEVGTSATETVLTGSARLRGTTLKP